jgi:rsbT co-antagonist protein RsbR
MGDEMTTRTNVEDLVATTYDKIASILLLLSEVTSGDFSQRLPTDLPEDDPFSALYRGINEMTESLAIANQRTAAYQKELEEKLRTIEEQRAAIRELSTPVIEIWEGVLCMPVVGVMDSSRSADMTEGLLRAIVDKKVRHAVIDITGIEVMDTSTADHFIRMARAVRMLGAQCVLTGISPGIAQTIVNMGLDLGGIVTHRSLRDALQHYVRGQRRNGAGQIQSKRGNGGQQI